MFDLIMTHENRVNIVAAGRSETDVRRVLTQPLTVMGSDRIAVDPNGPPGAALLHPRSEVPHRSPDGLTAVFVNGRLAVADGAVTGQREGSVR
jgi:hypothetical protein